MAPPALLTLTCRPFPVPLPLAAFALAMAVVVGSACAPRATTSAEDTVSEEGGDELIRIEVEGAIEEGEDAARRAARWEREGYEAPDTPAGQQLQWVLDTLEDEGMIRDLDEIPGRFAPAFSQQVQPRQLAAIFRQLSEALGDFALMGFEGEPAPDRLIGIIRAEDDQYFRLIIALLADDPALRMETLLVQPAPDLQPRRHTSWAEVTAALQALAPEVQLLAAEIEDGACTPLHAVDAGRQRPISSTFKIWVLGALAEAVETGDMRWEDQLALDADLYSTPTGTMQEEPPGTRHALRHFAQQMIRISDNTATDHLIAHLGRERIEDWLVRAGHAAPDANRPLLMTREAIAMKLAPGAALRDGWLSADPSGRRAIASRNLVDFDLMDALQEDAWTEPRNVEEIQWFASAEDLCRTFELLRTRSTAGGAWEPVLEFLGMNPGVPIDRERFPWVGYKGGSEPGTMSLNWLLLRSDGRWFFLSMLGLDPARALNEAAMIELAINAIQLLGEAP